MAGTARIVVRTTNDGSGWRQAEADAERFSGKITAVSAIATAGLLGLGAAATKIAADFEHGMDQVGAVAGASAAEMELLSAKAKQIGADTAFSATQAAGAMEELAASGLSVKDMLNGGADAAVALAAAGGTSLPNAARIASTAMSAWKIEGEGVVDVTNRIAAAANVSRFGVDDMGAAFGSVASTAAALNVGLPETTAAIAALADATNSGADAGTSLKTFLISLPGSSEQAKKAIREAGLEFFDAAGNLKAFPEVIDELNQKLNGLSQREKLDLVRQIFGTDGGRAALDLMQMTGAEFEALMDTMGDTSAADVAAQRMDNTKGAIEELQGSLETLAIAFGEKVLPAISGMAEGATLAVNAFGGLPESTQGLALGTTAIAVAAPAAVAGISAVAKAAMTLGTGAGSAQLKVSALALGVGALAVAADAILEGTTGAGLLDRVFGDVSKAEAQERVAKELAGRLSDVAQGAETVDAAVGLLEKTMDNYRVAGGRAMKETDAFGQIVGGADQRLFGFNVGLSDGVDNFKEFEARVSALGQAMMTNGATTTELARAYRSLPEELKSAFNEVTNIEAAFATYNARLMDADNFAKDARDEIEQMAASLRSQQSDTEGATTAFDEWIASLEEGIDIGQAWETVLEGMGAHMTSMHAPFNANETQIIRLREELDDLTASGTEYSESLGMTKGEIESLIETLESQNGALATNGEAYNDLIGKVDRYSQEAAFNLDRALANSTLSFEEQVDAVGLAATAFDNLAVNDIPNAIGAFETLQARAPEAAKAVGPEFVAQLQSSVADPAAYAPIIAWLESQGVLMGEAVGEGMERGMGSMIGSVAAKARSLAAAAVAEARAALQVESPSKVFFAIGASVGEGLAGGIEDAKPKALARLASLINDLVDGAREQLLAERPGLVSKLIGGGYTIYEDGSMHLGPAHPVFPGGGQIGTAAMGSGLPGWIEQAIDQANAFWKAVWIDTAKSMGFSIGEGGGPVGAQAIYFGPDGQPPIIAGVPVPGGATKPAGWKPPTGQPNMLAGVPVPGYQPAGSGTTPLTPLPGDGRVFWDPEKRDYVAYPNLDSGEAPNWEGWAGGKEGGIWAETWTKKDEMPWDASIVSVDNEGHVVWWSPTYGLGTLPNGTQSHFTPKGETKHGVGPLAGPRWGYSETDSGIADMAKRLQQMSPADRKAWLANPQNAWAAPALERWGYEVFDGSGEIVDPKHPYLGMGGSGMVGPMPGEEGFNAASSEFEKGLGILGTTGAGLRIWDYEQYARTGMDTLLKFAPNQVFTTKEFFNIPDSYAISTGVNGMTTKWSEALAGKGRFAGAAGLSGSGAPGVQRDAWHESIRNNPVLQAALRGDYDFGKGGVNGFPSGSFEAVSRLIDLGFSLEEAVALWLSGWHWIDGGNIYKNDPSAILAEGRQFLETGKGPEMDPARAALLANRVPRPSGGKAAMRGGSGGGSRGEWGDWGRGGNTVIINSPITTADTLRSVMPEVEHTRMLALDRSFAPFGGRR